MVFNLVAVSTGCNQTIISIVIWKCQYGTYDVFNFEQGLQKLTMPAFYFGDTEQWAKQNLYILYTTCVLPKGANKEDITSIVYWPKYSSLEHQVFKTLVWSEFSRGNGNNKALFCIYHRTPAADLLTSPWDSFSSHSHTWIHTYTFSSPAPLLCSVFISEFVLLTFNQRDVSEMSGELSAICIIWAKKS